MLTISTLFKNILTQSFLRFFFFRRGGGRIKIIMHANCLFPFNYRIAFTKLEFFILIINLNASRNSINKNVSFTSWKGNLPSLTTKKWEIVTFTRTQALHHINLYDMIMICHLLIETTLDKFPFQKNKHKIILYCFEIFKL